MKLARVVAFSFLVAGWVVGPAPAVFSGVEPWPEVGTIRGQVVDAGGLPIPGALVFVGSERMGRPSSDAPHAWIAQALIERASRATIETDDEGRFSIDDLPTQTTYRLTAQKEGYEFLPCHRVQVGDRCTLAGTAIVELRVCVRSPGGVILPEAELDVTRNFEGGRVPWSSLDPSFFVEPGLHTLRAWSGESYSREVSVWLQPGDPRRELTLVIQVLSRLELAIREVGQSPSDRYRVWLRPVADDIEEWSAEELFQSVEPNWASSRAELPDLEPGRYQIAVSRFPFEIEQIRTIEIEEPLERLEFELPPATAEQTLDVRARLPEGEGSSWRLTVRLSREGELFGYVDAIERRTGEGIALLVGKAFWRAIESGEKFLAKVEYHEFGTRTVSVTSSPLEVVFGTPGRLVIEVREHDGRPVSGDLRCVLESLAGRYEFGRRIEGTSDYEVTGLSPGSYQLEISGDTGTLHEGEVEIVSGDQVHKVTLPRGWTLRLAFPADDEARTVSVRPIGEDGRARRVEIPAGATSVEVERVYDGEYVLLGGPSQQEAQWIVVQGHTEIQLDLRPVRAIVVRVFDPDGAVAKVGLRDGDRIVALGIDGEFIDVADVEARGIIPTGEVIFRLRRNEELIDIPLDLERVFGSESFGADLVPSP